MLDILKVNQPARASGCTAGDPAMTDRDRATLRIGLLTGAESVHYPLALTMALAERGVGLDFIGSDDVDAPELHQTPGVRFLNLRGDQSTRASLRRKVQRIGAYYLRLMAYAAKANVPVLHILWNNKFEFFDRTLLMLYYRALGRRVVLTAHNINAGKRDGCDNALNRLTLRIQYRLCDRIFVHTQRMRDELQSDFSIPAERIAVIPFGINNTTPTTAVTGDESRRRLGLAGGDKVMLFFGNIAPYKGLEYLIEALPQAFAADPALRLVIAGNVKKGWEHYWRRIEQRLRAPDLASRVLLRIEHIPDREVEFYFKAADVFVMPYVDIFQSGVLFLAFNFGVPVVATDVGAFRDDIIEGRTGLLCRPRDPEDLRRAIAEYFASDLYTEPQRTRAYIRDYANERHSWRTVAAISEAAYRAALEGH